MQLRRANVTVEVETGAASGDDEIQLSVRSDDAVALFVVLTTKAEGRFDQNAFLLENSASVSFLSWVPVTDSVVELLKSSLRVEHLAEYLMM